jgi:hypothetical protein
MSARGEQMLEDLRRGHPPGAAPMTPYSVSARISLETINAANGFSPIQTSYGNHQKSFAETLANSSNGALLSGFWSVTKITGKRGDNHCLIHEP